MFSSEFEYDGSEHLVDTLKTVEAANTCPVFEPAATELSVQIEDASYESDSNPDNRTHTQVCQVTPQDKRRARALSISSTSSLCSSTSTSSWPSSNELQDMNFLIDEYQVCDTILSTNSATKLPLAGIKRHIKKYEGVSMVAAETPMVVAKLCEIFVKEMCSSVTNVEESEVQARHLAQCFMKDHFQRIWLRLASEANQETTENVKLVSLEDDIMSTWLN